MKGAAQGICVFYKKDVFYSWTDLKKTNQNQGGRMEYLNCGSFCLRYKKAECKSVEAFCGVCGEKILVNALVLKDGEKCVLKTGEETKFSEMRIFADNKFLCEEHKEEIFALPVLEKE